MLEWLSSAWDGTAQFFGGMSWQAAGVWTLTSCLLLVGIIGSVVPLLPGPFLILIAGITHTLLMPAGKGMSLIGIGVLILLLVGAYAVDFAAGAVGARWFGASRWGMAGVLAGGIVGLFFGPIGWIAGPLIGALSFELVFAKKRMAPAVKSTWGTVLGTGIGLILRFFISLGMVATMLLDTLVW